MKMLFKKFRASTALDETGGARQHCDPVKAHRFEESLCEMDRNLRKSREGVELPPGLHASIMRAVGKSGEESELLLTALLWRRVAVAALVLAVGAMVVWSVNRPTTKVDLRVSPPSLTAAIEQGQQLTQAAPNAVLGPLSGEMDLLNRDLQNAMNFVAASVP